MCLNCRTPRSEEIHDLDSFELAFLTMIGRVEWVDPFDYAFTLMKAANSHDSKIILWGPEAEMLFRVTERGFEEILLPVIDKIIAAFDLSGDITVDASRARALNMQLRNLGDEFAEYVKTPANAVFATIIENAEEHFTKQKDAVTKQLNEAGWRDYLRDANSNHLDAYLRKFPEDVIHPQIEKAIALAETSASRRLIDRGVLSERIGRLGSSIRMSLSELTDVEAGLAWTGTGLGLASETGVTHYIILAEEDNRTCPVCLRLNGRKVKVADAASTLESVLAGRVRHRFPRVPQIDNVSPELIEGMSLFPPFHPRCRCDLGFLWREAPRAPRVPRRPAQAPAVGDVPRAREILTSFPGRMTVGPKEITSEELAHALRQEALVADERVTGKLVTLADEAKAELQGLEFRIKGQESLVRKINTEMTDRPEWLLDDLLREDVNDVLRYTMVVDAKKYSDTIVSTLERLKSEGHEVVRVRNYWNNPSGYRGFNTVIKDVRGTKYELQFHTPETISTKEAQHIFYEKIRVATDPVEIAQWNKKITEAWDAVKLPPRVTTIGTELESVGKIPVPLRPAPLFPSATVAPVSPELLPSDYIVLSSKRQFTNLSSRLVMEGKHDAAKIVSEYRIGNGNVAVTYASSGEVKSFAQFYLSKGRPDTFRVLNMQGFGDDWLTSKYQMAKSFAKHALDEGRTVFQIDAGGLDAYAMKRFGFKKSGRFYRIEGDPLRRFAEIPITPRPIPPPPPPKVATMVAPPTPAPAASPDLELIRTGAWTDAELNERRTYFKKFVKDFDFSGLKITEADTLKYMETALDHIETADLKGFADYGLTVRVNKVGREGAFIHSDPRTHLPVVEIGETLSHKVIAHEFGHGYDWFNGQGQYYGWKARAFQSKEFGRLDENDARTFRTWWNEYTKDAPVKGSLSGFEFKAASWVDDYEGRLYLGMPDGVEWWSVNSARYSHYVQQARKVEKEIYETVRKYSVKGISETELSSLSRDMQNWVKGKVTANDLIVDATRVSKWQKGVDKYGDEVTNLIRKAYNYKPMDLGIAERMKPAIIKPPPEPVVPLTGKVPTKVPAYWRDMVLKNHRTSVQDYADRNKITVDEALQRLSDHVRELARNSSPWIRRQTTLQKILEDGRFKTQFETHTSSGCLSNSERAAFESEAGGIPRNLNPKDRMVYGYLSDDPDGMLGYKGMRVDNYGEIAFRLKPQVRERTTFILGDSLGNHSVSWDRIDEGSHYAIDRYFIDDFFSPNKGPYKKLNQKADGKILNRYWEAQYHWGLTADDIAEVILPINAGFGYTEAEVRRHFRKAIELMEKNNIPYRFLDRSGVPYVV